MIIITIFMPLTILGRKWGSRASDSNHSLLCYYLPTLHMHGKALFVLTSLWFFLELETEAETSSFQKIILL